MGITTNSPGDLDEMPDTIDGVQAERFRCMGRAASASPRLTCFCSSQPLAELNLSAKPLAVIYQNFTYTTWPVHCERLRKHCFRLSGPRISSVVRMCSIGEVACFYPVRKGHPKPCPARVHISKWRTFFVMLGLRSLQGCSGRKEAAQRGASSLSMRSRRPWF